MVPKNQSYYKDEAIGLPNSRFREFDNHIKENLIASQDSKAIFIHPQPADGDLTLYYYGDFDALSADSDSNH